MLGGKNVGNREIPGDGRGIRKERKIKDKIVPVVIGARKYQN